MNTVDDINARPLAVLKDPKAFPAPPVHRVAHGMQQPPPGASPQPPVQPQAQPYGYQQTPGPPQQAPAQPEYAQYQQASAAAYQPPAGPPLAQNTYQSPAGPPPAHSAYQPPAGPPPENAYQPLGTPAQYGQYQRPSASFVPPGWDPNAQFQAQPQQAAYAPPQPPQATYASQPAQAAYAPTHPTQAAFTPPPAASAFSPPTPGRPVPSLPPRANSVTAPPEPPAPVKAPLPDPSLFPKPPPYFGRQDSATSTHTAHKPSLPSRTTPSPSTFNPAPALPQRTTPSPSVQYAPVSVAAPPAYASVPPPALPARANSIVAPPAGAVHKKPPPPPVKSKDVQRHSSLPDTSEPSGPSNFHTPSPAPASAPAQPQHNQGAYGAIASQLDQAWNQQGAVGSFRDRLKSVTQAATSSSPSPVSVQAPPSDGSAHRNYSVHGIASQFGHMSMQPATPTISDSANGAHGRSASFQSKMQALNQAQPNFANELASRFNPMQPQAIPALEAHQTEPTPGAHMDLSSAARKKAPPPPPKKLPLKAAHTTSSAAASPQAAVAPPLINTPQADGTPPPINYATRPQFISGNTELASQAPVSTPVAAPVSVPVAEPLPGQKEFDLQLHTLWFTAPANSLQLPPTMSGLNYALATSRSGTSQTLIIAIRIAEDLAIVKYKLSWQNTDPQGTVRVERKEVPAPAPLPQTQLIQAHEQFGNGVASWAEAMMNKQVGDGECWTLAKEAIDKSSHGFALSPQSYTHGALVYHATGGAPAPIAYNDSIRRGDILQFTNGRFETRNAQGVVTGFSTVGMPNHTSVVTSVSANNRVVEIVQQNVSGVKKVQKGSHNLDELTQGDLKIFRPVWKEWAGEMETSW